jgi:hypothetical protein
MAAIIEIKPHRNGWKVLNRPASSLFSRRKNQAINYAQNRASFRSGEIRILDLGGNVERVIPFDDTNRKL